MTSDFDPLHTTLLMRLLGALCRVYLTGNEQLPAGGTVLAVRRSHAEIFKAVYGQALTERRGFVVPTGKTEGAALAAAGQIRAGRDALVVLSGESTSDPRLADALHLARTATCGIFPVGISTAPVLRPGRRQTPARPLPGARIVVVFEAPFEVPLQPERIPEAWGSAILNLLDRASGRAAEIEATWRKQGRRPYR